MIVQADKMSTPASREYAERLYNKNIELENKRRRSAQQRTPSDPNAWQLMRENYEAILLEDHVFAEQHNIEYALWQLHYKRIEELRAHFSALSQGSNTSQGLKGAARADRITKLRMQLKTFLSEATGFYHDLILKIRSKYGLPLGYSSEDSNNRIVAEKDVKKSSEMKKGLILCHRCLLYLGDLARYKGLYGEGDSKAREHAAASSYYLQALALWPSSGNPHHQLAILASYSGDELVTIYRYFRSLALESPFSTARDNLIVAFEKNRQNYSQLPGDVRSADVNEFPLRTGKGRSKVEIKLPLKETNSEAGHVKEKTSSIHEIFKVFCIRFVRLNGILFTRTSLETFAEVLSLVSTGLRELLSTGIEDELNFGSNAVENGLFIVRLIAILIFTVHNVNKETEGQTYAEILQRAVLVQNSFTAVFEIMGHILDRCVKLRDPSSSYLLPGILVFVEWLACCPDVAKGSDAEDKQATLRLKFWNQCISFLNKLLSVGPVCDDDDGEDTCFFKMSRYEEGETENRLALWEDFELRGYLPLLPAQSLLDFSRKLPYGSNDSKERKARVKRILAAGKALANIVKLDTKTIYFDPKVKTFVLGVEPLMAEDFLLSSYSSIPGTKDTVLENQAAKTVNLGVGQQSIPLHMEGEDDDDEEIVFKPAVTEKQDDDIGPKQTLRKDLAPGRTFTGDLPFYGSAVSDPLDSRQQASFDGNSWNFASAGFSAPHIQSHVPKWLVDKEASLANNLKTLSFLENGYIMKPEVQADMGILHPAAISAPMKESLRFSANGMFQGSIKATDPPVPTRMGAIPSSGVGSLHPKSSVYSAATRRNPVSRPVRHFGPPPGFSSVPTKQVNGLSSVSDLPIENPYLDYSWLDGHQFPPSTKSTTSSTYSNFPPCGNSQYVSITKELDGTTTFPFPGKHVPMVQFQMENQNGQQDQLSFEHFKSHHEPQLQQKQFINGNQQVAPQPEQFQGQSGWTGQYIV